MKLRYWLVTIFYCVGIFVMSHKPALIDVELPFPGADKLIHAILFGGLATIVSIGMRRSGKSLSFARQFYLPVLFATVYGISDEIHQYFVPGRHFDPLDILADTAGAVAVQIVFWALWRGGKSRNPE